MGIGILAIQGNGNSRRFHRFLDMLINVLGQILHCAATIDAGQAGMDRAEAWIERDSGAEKPHRFLVAVFRR